MWALEASDEQLKLASYGQRGTDLLVETPSDVVMLDRMLQVLRSKQLRITLAHPERSLTFQEEPSRLERLVEQGSCSRSPPGLLHRRSRPGRLVELLCRHDLAHALAFPTATAASAGVLIVALGAASRRRPASRARARREWMASTVPAAITAGEEIPLAPAIAPAPGRRGLFRRRVKRMAPRPSLAAGATRIA